MQHSVAHQAFGQNLTTCYSMSCSATRHTTSECEQHRAVGTCADSLDLFGSLISSTCAVRSLIPRVNRLSPFNISTSKDAQGNLTIDLLGDSPHPDVQHVVVHIVGVGSGGVGGGGGCLGSAVARQHVHDPLNEVARVEFDSKT